MNEDRDESKQCRPPCIRNELGNDEGRDDHLQEQQAITCLRIRKGERYGRDLDCLVELAHPICQLLEGPGEQWRRDRQNTETYVLDNQLLDPLVDQLDPRIRVLNLAEALAVDACRVHQLISEGCDVCDVVTAAVLDLCQGHCVKQAEEANDHVFKPRDILLGPARMAAESDDGAASIEPFCPHLVRRGAAVPEAAVRLRCAEDDEETHEECEAAPHSAHLQHALLVIPGQDIQLTRVHEPLQDKGSYRAGQGHAEGRFEDAAMQLQDPAENILAPAAVVDHGASPPPPLGGPPCFGSPLRGRMAGVTGRGGWAGP
mmetsp:Transcript_12185/g.33458  ORF Transcript_12185/g.33458 Transcript_12185/m.33458 type:complete len:316 (-) Transcript_12185:2-949(-)